MPSAEENYLLMWCIIEQKMDDKGTLTLDWEKITTKMGSDNVGSTKSRWARLRADFQKMGFMKGPEAVDLAAFKAQAQAPRTKTPKAATTPKPKKTANPKARSAVEKKGAAKAKGKKSKAEIEEDDDQKEDAEVREVESDANVERMKEDGSDEEET